MQHPLRRPRAFRHSGVVTGNCTESGFLRYTTSLIVKSVHLPKQTTHPRGWSGKLGHKRKIRSYQVESAWYRDFAPRFANCCPMPTAFHLESPEHGFLLVLSDLDAAGYSARPTSLENRDLAPYLSWLATFHALGLTSSIEGLWNPGSYWHLQPARRS